MFIVQPFQRQTSIRSILGFMSLATRWGDYLFPGITVLTRDLHDVKAIHETAIAMRVGESPRKRHEFQRPETDRKIAYTLSKLLSRENMRFSPNQLTQRMTYWQRYGSLISHFGLLDEKRTKSVDGYREMIFSDRCGPANEEPAIRRRRITHFKWYRHNRHNIPTVAGDDVHRLFVGQTGSWRHWWLTGLRPPADAPIGVRLVRELEFFFVVWQTLFEASALLLRETGRADVPKGRRSDPSELLVAELVDSRTNGPLKWQKLMSLCLQIHDRVISPRVTTWQEKAIELIGIEKNADRFVKLHNGKDIESLGKTHSTELPEALAELHVTYCELQGKRHAVCAFSFKHRKRGPNYPMLSADFTSSRWGLFSYRFQSSQTLFESLRYSG
jgi:hypothetical protein